MSLAVPTPSSREAEIATKAVVRAADRLGLSSRGLAAVIGLSEATVSRMTTERYVLDPGGKPFELALLLVRLYRSLDAITGGDDAVARAWLKNPNEALRARPLDQIRTVTGLMDVIRYLDARRALV